MSIAHEFPFEAGLASSSGPPVPPPPGHPRPLHRIAEARRQQGISARSAARRLRTTMDQVRREEDPNCDMPLSELELEFELELELPPLLPVKSGSLDTIGSTVSAMSGAFGRMGGAIPVLGAGGVGVGAGGGGSGSFDASRHRRP